MNLINDFDGFNPFVLLASGLTFYGLYRLISLIGSPRLVIEITLENDTKITFPVRRKIRRIIKNKFDAQSKMKKERESILSGNPSFGSKQGIIYK